MRFFFSPWEFRLPSQTICPSLHLENSVCQAERSVRLFALRIPSARPNDLSVSSPWEFFLPGRTICLARFRRSIKMRNCTTVRAGSVASTKTWNRRWADGQTHCCNYIRDRGYMHVHSIFPVVFSFGCEFSHFFNLKIMISLHGRNLVKTVPPNLPDL